MESCLNRVHIKDLHDQRQDQGNEDKVKMRWSWKVIMKARALLRRYLPFSQALTTIS